jgi:hypothetical protein
VTCADTTCQRPSPPPTAQHLALNELAAGDREVGRVVERISEPAHQEEALRH